MAAPKVFNEFNSRKPEELNIFSGVSRNHVFLGVVSVTVVMQVIIIDFLGKFTSTVTQLGALACFCSYCVYKLALGFCSKIYSSSKDSIEGSYPKVLAQT